MRYIADFHLHSKYSRATSQQMDLENLEKWARWKGIQILGTGDFTHPLWFKELKEKLEPLDNGFFRLKTTKDSAVYFILTTEVSCIYTKKGVVRRIHLIIFFPDFQSVEKFNTQLSWSANLKADGRPMLGLDAKEILRMVLEISAGGLVVPAHVWTPWYSIFGSKSGFDSLEECFDELRPYIYAIETGLSSDPPMNWRLSKLDQVTLISCSDSHSPQNLGREATVFEFSEVSYQKIIETLKKKDPTHLKYTIEFFPEEGKYHFDGHRLCQVSFSPAETKKRGGFCPACGKPLTIGVMHRVDKLADRPEGFIPENVIPFKSLVPLREIIAESLGVEKNSKAIEQEYLNLIEKGGSEFQILLDLGEKELAKIASEKIVEGILKMRQGKVQKIAGYDGVYGKINVFNQLEEKKENRQGLLFKF
ncbi:MAG: endonuclease Q family protein [Patescibacteria group bacterium]|nr:endonuclease Q family protein [Patescibacteria group bacterium]